VSLKSLIKVSNAFLCIGIVHIKILLHSLRHLKEWFKISILSAYIWTFKKCITLLFLKLFKNFWSYGSDSSGSRRGSDTRPCRPRWLTSWSACQHVLPRGRRVAPDRSRPTSVFPGRSLSRVCPHWNGENKWKLRQGTGKKSYKIDHKLALKLEVS